MVAVSRKKTALTRLEPDYEAVLTDVVGLVEAARHASARAVNSLITATYWSIGRRIVEQEQHGKARADYGAALVERLATDLTARFGRGSGRRNLLQMRAFFLRRAEVPVLPLPWSHYVRLLTVRSAEARRFYETEALGSASRRFLLPSPLGRQCQRATSGRASAALGSA